MPKSSIGNPGGAFGEPAQPESDVLSVLNTGAAQINENEWVSLDVTGTSGHIYGATRGLDTLTGPILGIAAENIPVGATGQVVVGGPATGIAGGDITTGDQLIVSDSVTGALAVASEPTVGTVIGWALATQATSGDTLPVWVQVA